MMNRPVDPKIWRACAGATVQVPTVNSIVYYFPQGHLNEATSPPQNLSPLLLSKPRILCTISSIQFLADPETDEVFAKLVLHPLNTADLPRVPNPTTAATAADGEDDDDEDDRIISFAMILTSSDVANNGGDGLSLSIPRSCAESVFPGIYLPAEMQSLVLEVTDVHGKAWRIRHSYNRRKSGRHMLTVGWDEFVDSKKLIAGDSVVFMKNSTSRKVFTGIRRGSAASSAKGKQSPESVAEAAEIAAKNNEPFEVVYYPKGAVTGWSDFVVKAEVVEEALSVSYGSGMRVKMGVETTTDDLSRITWFEGTVSSLVFITTGPWPSSSWRMLQIAWDKPEVLKNSKWVSPWQVKLVTPAPLQIQGIDNSRLD